MNAERQMELRKRMENSRYYRGLQRLSQILDRYYLDATLGLVVPGGIGDTIAAAISSVYVFFSAFHIRSFTLTMAIVNNILRDMCLGMIPFFVGDIIDVFHRSNLQNMELIKGYVEGDTKVIKAVRSKAAWNVVIFFCLCFCIALLFVALKYLYNLLF